jgi:hypothetical protein
MATATASRHPEDLVQSLEKHNETFTSLLSLIPSRYYIALAPEEVSEGVRMFVQVVYLQARAGYGLLHA